MAIDPMHLPILGDPEPTDPPLAVRVASGLLLAHAGVTLVFLAHSGLDVAVVDPALLLVPLLLTVGFALVVRSGREWTRAVSCLAAFLSLVLTIGMVFDPLGLLLVVVSGALILLAARSMYRPEVHDYFQPAETTERGLSFGDR